MVASKRLKGLLILSALVLAALTFGFWPRAVPVETAEAARRPLAITVEEEARTRVKERYVVHAPVAGLMRRIDLEVGDAAPLGAVIASLDPTLPAVLDPRGRAEAEARVAAARAELERREAGARQAEAEAQLAASEFTRIEGLLGRGLVSQREFDQAQASLRAREAGKRAADSAVDVGRYELEAARAVLRYTAGAEGGRPVGTVALRSPVDGVVLKLHQESAGVVSAGQPLIEVGDPAGLEVECEVLSRDAVRIAPGGRVLLERWGGDTPLEGVVRLVEPTGFTKISALGVEEQRVRVIVDITSPPAEWQRLGDGYRVEARFVVWERQDVLTVPTSALFRRDGGHAVFVVERGRARVRTVVPGHGSGLLTEIAEGIAAGERVVVHPGESVADGVRVRRFRENGTHADFTVE
ncbi:MAG: efflux RND transporter periplasmic adaptor subunit [Steroidobacteraceae bacterium]|jgi:HlyD family secretion protein|nr:efflux RND transporter periplasmic adaptor subunit [Steroidobacteraceae bacterium]